MTTPVPYTLSKEGASIFFHLFRWCLLAMNNLSLPPADAPPFQHQLNATARRHRGCHNWRQPSAFPKCHSAIWFRTMNAIIISIGNELTFGQTVDTNSAWLSQRLAEIGVHVIAHVTVADELEPVRREIVRACELADVVLISGGLGPTEDDLTRQALAAAMGVELQLRPELLDEIRDFFTRRNREMPESNRIQAMFPAGSEPIHNTCGTAPGIRASARPGDDLRHARRAARNEGHVRARRAAASASRRPARAFCWPGRS